VQPQFSGAIKGIPAGPANWGLLDPRSALRKWHDDGGGWGMIVGMISFLIAGSAALIGAWVVTAIASVGVLVPLIRTGLRYVEAPVVLP
jgi:hypothetical protein